MKTGAKVALWMTAISIGVVGFAWWWTRHMERKWEAVPTYDFKSSLGDFQGLEQFLKHSGIPVEHRQRLSNTQAEVKPSDAIFLPQSPSHMDDIQRKWLLSWIGQGGTLFVQCPWKVDSINNRLLHSLGVRTHKNWEPESTEDEDESEDTTEGLESSLESDSTLKDDSEDLFDSTRLILPGLPESGSDTLSDELDSSQSTACAIDSTKPFQIDSTSPNRSSPLHLPGVNATLRVLNQSWDQKLIATDSQRICSLVWRDTLDSSLLVLSKGKGFVIVSSSSYSFSNGNLNRFDNAEVFLRLISWKAKPSHLWMFKDSGYPSWYKWLWDHAAAVMLFALALVAAWIWSHARRFGPEIPDTESDRRPLLEHIDASARWIWNAPDGPETLLSALRASVQQNLALRHPAWARLPIGELSEELAALHGVSAQSIRRALDANPKLSNPSPTPQEFVRMVKLLQKLKDHP